MNTDQTPAAEPKPAMACKRCGNPLSPDFGGTWTHRPIPGVSHRDYRHRIIAIPAASDPRG